MKKSMIVAALVLAYGAAVATAATAATVTAPRAENA